MNRDRRQNPTTRLRRERDGRSRLPRSQRPPGPLRVSEEEFETLVEKAVEQLPGEFAARVQNVVIVVEEEPDPAVLEELGEDEILGLYEGLALTERQDSLGLPELPDRVLLYRGPLLRLCTTRRHLIREIRDTLVHELGHYFGLSDDDMPY